MNYIYIDESGELAKKSNYFVIGAIKVNDSKQLDRIINKTRRTYKKQLGNVQEFKGHKVKKHIKKKLLKEINKLNAEITIIILDKANKHKINYKDDYNILYDLIASELAKEINITSNTNIIIDKSKTKERHILRFNNLFLNSLNNSKNFNINLDHKNSINYKGLQIIDLLVWSVFQSVENNNKEYIQLIENIKIKKVYED